MNTINTPANNFGIAEFGGQAPSQSDLNKFYNKFAPNVPQNTGPTVYSIEHGPGLVPPIDAGDEADIDFEIAISLVYPQVTTLYSVGKFRTRGYTAEQQNDLTFVTPLLDGTFLASGALLHTPPMLTRHSHRWFLLYQSGPQKRPQLRHRPRPSRPFRLL